MSTLGFRDSSSQSTSGASTNKSVVLPGTVQQGDFMILGWSATQSGGGNLPTATPTGWHQIRTGTSNNAGGAAYWKIATSGDAGTTVTVPSSGATKASIVVGVYFNSDSTAPITVSNIFLETATQLTHTNASITTTASGWRVSLLLGRDGATPSTTWAPPSPMVAREDTESGSTNQAFAVLADSNGDSTAGTYAGNWTVDQTSNNAVTIQIGLSPVTSTTTIRPISDDTNAGFTTVPSGGNIYQVTADDDPTTYSISPLGGGVEKVKMDACAVAPTQCIVSGFAASAATQSITTKVYQGASLIATFGPETALVTVDTTYTYNFSGGNQTTMAAGNLSDLHVEVTSAMT